MFKKRNAFTVFFTAPNEELNGLELLRGYVTAVDIGTELFEPVASSTCTHRTNNVILWLKDDAENKVIRTIREWAKQGNHQFTLHVYQQAEAENGHMRTTDMYVFKHAQMHALQHSILTVESKDGDERQDSIKLLQLAFAEMEHTIIDNIQ